MSNNVLLEAIVDTAVFLGLSGGETIDEDAAISQMESLAATLKKLTPDERSQFEKFVAQRAREARTRGDIGHAEFLESLYENLGLNDE